MASKRSPSNSKPIFLSFYVFLLSFTFIRSSVAENQPVCADNFVELDVCIDVLGALSRGSNPSKNYCCSLIGNLVQLEANCSCLCNALEIHVLDVIKREIPVASLSLLFDYCESEIPPDFRCGNLLLSYSSSM